VANAVPDPTGGNSSGPTAPIPKNAPPTNDTGHQSFLLLMGEVIGVFILAWIASFSERLGMIVVAFLVVLWLIWIMNNAGANGVVQRWATKVGL